METKYIQAFFDSRAAHWDETCHHDPRRMAAVASLAQIHPGDRVLDKTTPRLIQFHTLKNAVNPPFLGGFLISGTVAA